MRTTLDLRIPLINWQLLMNTVSTSSTPAASTQCAEENHADESAKAETIKPFSFPFSPEVFAPAKSNNKPWHQHGNKSNHDKRPDAAPKGSRRSMGKR